MSDIHYYTIRHKSCQFAVIVYLEFKIMMYNIQNSEYNADKLPAASLIVLVAEDNNVVKYLEL